MNKIKQNINWLLVILFGIIIGVGFSLTIINQSNEVKPVTTIIKNDSTLLNKIKELEEENDILRDEIQLREGEISYWGRKYEDLKNKKND